MSACWCRTVCSGSCHTLSRPISFLPISFSPPDAVLPRAGGSDLISRPSPLVSFYGDGSGFVIVRTAASANLRTICAASFSAGSLVFPPPFRLYRQDAFQKPEKRRPFSVSDAFRSLLRLAFVRFCRQHCFLTPLRPVSAVLFFPYSRRAADGSRKLRPLKSTSPSRRMAASSRDSALLSAARYDASSSRVNGISNTYPPPLTAQSDR